MSWATVWERQRDEHQEALLASATPIEDLGATEMTEVHGGKPEVRVMGRPTCRRTRAVVQRRRS
jgi:hypothetical protein